MGPFEAFVRVDTAVPRISDAVQPAAVAAADPRALRALYMEHGPALRSFARRLLSDDAAAEDLVHETFVTLPGAIAGYRGDAPLRTFLFSIAVNVARHHIRAAVRRRAREESAELPPASGSNPEKVAMRRELAARLTRALDKLPDDQRVAFVLCEVEGHSGGEVANMVGAREETVRARVFHAKKKLRALLRGEEASRGH